MPSIMQRIGTPNPRHNLDNEYRKHLPNVDASLSKHNKVLRRKSVEEIYEEHLQPAFVAFNEKQKRKDRRLDVKYGVDTYLGYQRALDKAAQQSNNAIDKKGRPPIREIVWQIGNPEQGYGSLGQTNESRAKIMGMLLEAQAEAERRYPQFKWGDLSFHADEVSKDANDKEMGSLHLHSSFVPLCLQNKQGPAVQVAFERCLREMGFSSFEAWKHDLDNIMETVLERYGLQRTFMDNHEKHQDSRQFHRQQKVIKETKDLEAMKEKAASELEELQTEVEDLGNEKILLEGEIAISEAKRLAEEEKYEELQRTNEANIKIIDQNNEQIDEQVATVEYNDRIIQQQEDALQLIVNYEEYLREGAAVDQGIDLLEAAAKELPATQRLFKAAEANAWLRRMEKILEEIRRLIELQIKRLRIYEHTYEVKEPLSADVSMRVASLDEQIFKTKSYTEPGANFGSMDVKTQEMIDAATGTDYAEEFKLKYYRNYKGRKEKEEERED